MTDGVSGRSLKCFRAGALAPYRAFTGIAQGDVPGATRTDCAGRVFRRWTPFPHRSESSAPGSGHPGAGSPTRYNCSLEHRSVSPSGMCLFPRSVPPSGGLTVRALQRSRSKLYTFRRRLRTRDALWVARPGYTDETHPTNVWAAAGARAIDATPDVATRQRVARLAHPKESCRGDLPCPLTRHPLPVFLSIWCGPAHPRASA